jgi:hypothetical protein
VTPGRGLRRRPAALEGRRTPPERRWWHAEEELLPEALAAVLGRSGELPRWRGCAMAGLIERDPALAEAVAAARGARTGVYLDPADRLA